MKLFIITIFAALLLAGCTKVSDISGPTQQTKPEFLKLNISQAEKTEGIFTTDATIDGSVGGEVNFYKTYYSNGNKMTLEVELNVPAGAYSGIKNIGYKIDNATGTLDFFPSMSFENPLTLNYKIEGVDLSNYSKSTLIDFFYLDGDNYVLTQYGSKKVNIKKGILEVNNALLTHFSRYGWATLDGADATVID